MTRFLVAFGLRGLPEVPPSSGSWPRRPTKFPVLLWIADFGFFFLARRRWVGVIVVISPAPRHKSWSKVELDELLELLEEEDDWSLGSMPELKSWRGLGSSSPSLKLSGLPYSRTSVR